MGNRSLPFLGFGVGGGGWIQGGIGVGVGAVEEVGLRAGFRVRLGSGVRSGPGLEPGLRTGHRCQGRRCCRRQHGVRGCIGMGIGWAQVCGAVGGYGCLCKEVYMYVVWVWVPLQGVHHMAVSVC